MVKMIRRKIINYKDVKLGDLDANVGISLGKGWDEHERIYAVPGFLIIGGQKCGTSPLKTWLSIHPNLQTMPLESHFFDEVVDLEQDWRRYVINPYFYLRDPKHIYYTFEKTPDYLDKRNAHGVSVAELVKQMMPSGKFIVLLRNPTNRAHSIYKMRLRQQALPLQYSRIEDTNLRRLERGLCLQNQVFEAKKNFQTFDEVVRERIQAITTGNRCEAFTREQMRMLTVGHYAEHLEEWFKHFDRNQFLILRTEEFHQDPFKVMRKVFEFLNLPYIDYSVMTCKRGRFHELLGHKVPSVEKLPFQEMSTDWIKPYLVDMNPETKELLDGYFQPWNEKLKALLPELTFPW